MTAMVKSSFHLYFRSSHHLYSIFLSRVKMNSINWPAPNIWVFIAQLVEHCSANAEAMGSNPVEALKFFSGLNLQLLKLRLWLRWSNPHFIIMTVFLNQRIKRVLQTIVYKVQYDCCHFILMKVFKQNKSFWPCVQWGNIFLHEYDG